MGHHVLDVGLAGLDGAVGATLLVGDVPVLVDPGPSAGLDRLHERAEAAGVPLADVRHLCLTHVHLDHAGAAGHLADRYPGLTLHVHEEGAPHLVDPTRLVASTRRSFGDAHDRLWGEVRPVPAHRIRAWRRGDRGPLRWLRGIATPGHIAHHVSWLDERAGTLVAGDALGILLAPGAPLHPATPPPAIDLGAWLETLDELRLVGPERAVWSHFGTHDDPVGRAVEFRATLLALYGRVGTALAAGRTEEDAADFDGESRAHLRPWVGDAVDPYFDAFSAAADYAGVQRFIVKNPGWSPPATS